MKGRKFLYTSVIACGMLAGCASENPSDVNNGDNGNNGSEVNPPSELYRMTFNASTGNSQDTRASVDEGSLNNGQNIVRWDKGDNIMVWTGGNASHLTECKFTTKEGGVTSATFEYEGAEVDSYTYFGYYPYAEGLNYSSIDINVPTDGSIVQAVKNSSLHLGAYRPMYTSVVSRSENSPELTGMTFKHLTGLLYFRIRNMSGQDSKVESVSLICSENVFSNHAVLGYSSLVSDAEPEFSVSGANLSESVSLTLGNEGQGITISNGEIMQAFLPILPVNDLKGKKLTFIVRADGHDHVSMELNGNEVGAFDKSVYYRIGLTVTHNGIEVEPVISGWEQGDEIDVPVR